MFHGSALRPRRAFIDMFHGSALRPAERCFMLIS